MHELNPCTEAYVHQIIKEEIQERIDKRINKLFHSGDFGWKIPSKKITIKNNSCVDNSSCVSNNRQNKFSMLEDAEEEEDDSANAELLVDYKIQEPKNNFGVKNFKRKGY